MAAISVLLAAAVAAVSVSQSVVFADSVVARSRDVSLADVADLSALPENLRSRAQTLVLVHFAPGQTTLRVSSLRLAERARAQLPALAYFLAADAGNTITIRLEASGPPALAPSVGTAANCMKVLQPIAAGAAPLADDLSAAPCGESVPTRAFSYDRAAHVARAARDLNPGDTVVAIPTTSFAAVRAGSAYVVTARVGPVVVQRRVIAVQSARPGGRMFVAGDDGEVFTAPQPAGTEAP